VPLYGDSYSVPYESKCQDGHAVSHNIFILLSYVYTEHYLAKPLTCAIIFETRSVLSWTWEH